MALPKFIKQLPKAELHLHIEGTLEPELLFGLARKNRVKLKFRSVSELRKAYNFSSLQDFLDLYYAGCDVLRTEEDFYALTMGYFAKAHEQGVMHAEIFFDPQTHTARGVQFGTVIRGIHRGCTEARKRFSISSKIIMCFLRHLPEKNALDTLKQALKYRKWIEAVGLDSGEKGNPPSKFRNVFSIARKYGFKAVAHAGEEGPSNYVWQALRLLKVSRIDHGNHALDDAKLVSYLAKKRIPLTVCPLSNLKLRVVKDIRKHPLRKMMDAGLLVTVNSDDPAYFGGYVGDNYSAMQKALKLTDGELAQIARNSFEASFLPENEKSKYVKMIDSMAGLS